MAGTVAPQGDAGGIYARISHLKDEDQTGVDRQERICRENAARAGVRVDPSHVFVDPSRSAWQRNRKRPGWDRLLAAIRAGEIRHLFVYHPDRLMRQPLDLEELLKLVDQHPLMLHGKVGKRDLTDPDDRYYLRLEIAHACRSSDDTSRRVRDQQKEQMDAGMPHGGMRCYGYSADMSVVVHEADVVREIYRRFLAGESIRLISRDLNDRGVPTALGKLWLPQSVRQLLDRPRSAGLIAHNGQVLRNANGGYRLGAWPPIVSVGDWEEVARLRQVRSIAFEESKAGRRRMYLLRSLVLCECGTHMAGSKNAGYGMYSCANSRKVSGKICRKRISAARLEELCTEAVLRVLEELTVAPDGSGALTTTAEREAEIAAIQQRLDELNEVWRDPEMKMPTAEYKSQRKDLVRRLEKANRATAVRPHTALEGIVLGAGARDAWSDPRMTPARKAAVFRYFFAAVRIRGTSLPPPSFDHGRISIEWNPLS
jgi:site-specific DNA recombinase